MNHGLEAHVNLATADDLSDIGWVVGLEQSNLETFLLEESLALGEVQGGVVRGRVPKQNDTLALFSQGTKIRSKLYQLVKNVILSVDILANFDQIGSDRGD